MEDKLGSGLIDIQAKKRNDGYILGGTEVQAFVGAIAGKGGKGTLVAASKFSKQAIIFNQSN